MDVSWMYTKSRNKPVIVKKSLVSFYIGGIIILVFLIGSVGGYIFYKSKIDNQSEAINPEKDCEKIISTAAQGKAIIKVCVKKDGNLLLLWENLPNETTKISIYFKDKESGERRLLKEVDINGESGSLDLGLADTTGEFEFEIKDSTGKVLNNPQAENPSSSGSQNTPPVTPSNNSNQNNPSTQPTPTTPTTPSTPTTPNNNTTSSSNPTPPPIENTSTQIYYTPQGEVSGTSSIPLANFWVTHVHKKIEIGWQNIPANSTKIIIYRSTNETNGYEKLLEQQNPKTDYDFIRVDDNTVYESYYYKLETRTDSTLLQAYGPIFLPGL